MPRRVVIKFASPRHLIECSQEDKEALFVNIETWFLARNGCGLSIEKTMARIIFMVYAREGIVSKEEIHEYLYGHRKDGGPLDKIISVYACKIRPVVAALGLQLKTEWGMGYEMEAV